MTPCYNACPMDKETLRKQLYEEIHTQFEEKLREAKRQKTELEEELEQSSEKWRVERRRLNSEIDRLETKVGEAREARKKAPLPAPENPLDSGLGKLQAAAAEEKLNKATQDFDVERKRLQGEISRLQGGIADLIERSNNPLRTNQVEKDKFDTKLEEALRAKRQAEDALIAARAEWEEEKLKLVAETVRLRRPSGPAKPVRDEELEKRLQEVQRSRDAISADLEKARNEVSKVKQSYSAEIDVLSAQLDKSKKEQATFERQLREAGAAREKAEQELEKTRDATSLLKSSSAEGHVRLKEQLEDVRAEAKAAARRLEETKALAAKEKAALEKQLREASASKERLDRDLERARQTQTPAGKDTPSAEVTRLKSELESARAEAKVSASRLEEAKTTASKERTSLEKQLRDAAHAQEKLERELDKFKHAPVAAKETQSAEVARLKQELEAARVEAREAAASVNEIRAAAVKERTNLEKQLRDASSNQERIDRELDRMKQSAGPGKLNPTLDTVGTKELEAARAEARMAASASREHAATIARLNNELKEARESLKIAQSQTGGAGGGVPSSDIVEQLRRQYDERMQAMIQEKSALSEQLREATSRLEAERQRLGAGESPRTPSNGDGINKAAIDAEVERIQGMIAGIARIIDDPETELSTVIRKNVERAELDAYLKGILFSLGRGKGL